MHTIIETDAFVIKSHAHGEANKTLELFTRQFGLIRAHAQGLRYIKSKLRYSLSDFSWVRVSLVRGKDMWRVTTAHKVMDLSHEISSVMVRESLYRIFALLRRLLQGEEGHTELFEIISSAVQTVASYEKHDEQEVGRMIILLEELAMLRLLAELGYVGERPVLARFLGGTDFSLDLLTSFSSFRTEAAAELQRALHATGLM